MIICWVIGVLPVIDSEKVCEHFNIKSFFLKKFLAKWNNGKINRKNFLPLEGIYSKLHA